MSDPVEKIKQLKARKAELDTLATQTRTRIESIEEQRSSVVEKMAAMGVAPEDAEATLEKLKAKRDALLEEVTAVLDAAEA